MLGQWACAKCQTLIQAPVPAAVIGKGIATAGLMANLVVSKYIDHQPLFRLEAIMGRSGCPFSVPLGRVGGHHRRATGAK